MSGPDTKATELGRGRGRPPRPELAERRRQELVEAAYEVFSTKGYAAAGIADIAERLQIGHGTFYRYFESKRDILDHVVDFGVERAINIMGLDRPPPGIESIEEMTSMVNGIVDNVFQLVDNEPGLVRVIMMEATSIDEEMTQRVYGLGDTFAALAGSYIATGVDSGILRADLDTEIVGKGLTGLMIPGLIQVLRGPFAREDRERYKQVMIALIGEGLLVRQSRDPRLAEG